MEMKITFPGGLRVDAAFGDRVIATDQSVAGGGEGSAPEPYSLFLASIGTCAGIYVLSFCKNHGLPTEGVSLTQRMQFDPKMRRLARIDLEITVPPDFPERHRRSLVRSAELCAVKKALADPPEIVVSCPEDERPVAAM
jgi:ribosomal protein S12 methylthiotransferase accessory factor